MTFLSLLIHEVTVFNPVTSAGTDRYGNELDTFDTGTFVPKARVDERGSSENEADRDTRIKSYLVFLPPEVVISGLSYLEWDGRRLKVDGEPDMKYDSAAPHHWEVNAKEVLG